MTAAAKSTYLSIRRRLVEEQRAAISAAAESDETPVAVELMIDQIRP